MADPLRVLFLCTGNSCRSQMAEGWARHLKGGVIDAYSAGVAPCGVSARTIAVMREAGVDISQQPSKHVDDLAGIEFDHVVTLCGSARDRCPAFTGGTHVVHVGFDDPAGVFSSEEAVTAGFRRVRDEIRAFIETLPESLTANP